jgi:hypothetical protein
VVASECNALTLAIHEAQPEGMSAMQETDREDGERRPTQVFVRELRIDDKQAAGL